VLKVDASTKMNSCPKRNSSAPLRLVKPIIRCSTRSSQPQLWSQRETGRCL